MDNDKISAALEAVLGGKGYVLLYQGDTVKDVQFISTQDAGSTADILSEVITRLNKEAGRDVH